MLNHLPLDFNTETNETRSETALGIGHFDERSQPTIAQTIRYTLAVNQGPLPVAPRQPGIPNKKGNEAYTGKNPSYLDRFGLPHLVDHRKYQNQAPSKSELKEWFENTANGVGMLLTEHVAAVDIDVKCYGSQEECDDEVEAWLLKYPQMHDVWTERTHSGGYRFIFRLQRKKDFTNFCFEAPGNPHVGEVLGSGRFTVLAPTIGPSGNPYIATHRPEQLPEVESLEAIGIFASRTTEGATCGVDDWEWEPAPEGELSLSIEKLQSKYSEKTLTNKHSGNNDRSKLLTAGIREWVGWHNWLKQQGLHSIENPLDLAYKAGDALGLDEGKVERIWSSIAGLENCVPGVYSAAIKEGKDGDAASRQIVLRREKAAYNHKWGQGSPDATGGVDDAAPSYSQIVFESIFDNPDNPWIYYAGNFYRWVGTHYQRQNTPVVERLVSDYCNSYTVWDEDKGKYKYPLASATRVRDSLKWAESRLAVDPDAVNSPGYLNCTNGALKLSWEGQKPFWELIPHTPELLITVEPGTAYDPEADPTECDRLLEVLDPEPRALMLKLLAATLDLPAARQRLGRGVKTPLLVGEGSNGKDALKVAMMAIYGNLGVTGATLADFKQYDQGRKFGLAQLLDSRVNWPSENSNRMLLDEIQSLKNVATGNPIECERKGVDSYMFTPHCLNIFNTNTLPNVEGGKEAMRSRYVIIEFKKVFKESPDLSKGELRADPRFAYDKEWLAENVLPAFLNKLLAALAELVDKGIDYTCTEAALEEARLASNHLLQFAADVQLKEEPDSELPLQEIYEQLTAWYREEGMINGNFLQENDRYTDPVVRASKHLKGRLEKVLRFGTRKLHGKLFLTGLSMKGMDYEHPYH